MEREYTKKIIDCDLCKDENIEFYKILKISEFYNYHVCSDCQQKLADFLEEIEFYK